MTTRHHVGTRKKGRPRVFIWTGDKLHSKVDVSGFVRAFSVSGKVQGPGARFDLTLFARQAPGPLPQTTVDRWVWLFQRLRANRLVSIGFDEPGGIGLFLISDIRRIRKRGGAMVDLGLKITGMNLGKVLSQDNVVKAQVTVPDSRTFQQKISQALGPDTPLLTMLEGLWGPKSGGTDPDKQVNVFVGKSVRDVVDWILNKAVSMQLPILAEATGGTGKAGDFIDTSTTVTVWNDGRLLSMAPHQYNGTIWGFIQSILDRDFYEVRVDNVPNGSDLPRTVLVIRPKPFDEDILTFAPTDEQLGTDWESVTTLVNGKEHHVIHAEEIMNGNLGFGDAEALGYYLVLSNHELAGNEQGQAEGLFYPVVDTWNVKNFGLRSYNARLQVVAADIRRKVEGDEDYSGEVATEVREMRNRLLNWYRLNPYFLTGSVVVEGRDEYRPGDIVYLPDEYATRTTVKGVRLYVSGVTHHWTFGGHYECTLQLERGHNDAMVEAIKDEIEADAPASNPSHLAET